MLRYNLSYLKIRAFYTLECIFICMINWDGLNKYINIQLIEEKFDIYKAKGNIFNSIKAHIINS